MSVKKFFRPELDLIKNSKFKCQYCGRTVDIKRGCCQYCGTRYRVVDARIGCVEFTDPQCMILRGCCMVSDRIMQQETEEGFVKDYAIRKVEHAIAKEIMANVDMTQVHDHRLQGVKFAGEIRIVPKDFEYEF